MLIQPARKLGRALKCGFTLIELLAVILIISILMTFLLPKIPAAIDAAEVTACSKNMQNIYQGLTNFKVKYKRAPKNGGVKFFAELITSKVWENNANNAKTLTCPGVETSALVGLADLPEEEWFSDYEAVNGDYSAYAGRDTEEYPLKKFLSGKSVPLVADDNEGGMNHSTGTNVLFSDGSVQTFELYDLALEGVLMEDEEILYVGPDSQLEVLREFTLD